MTRPGAAGGELPMIQYWHGPESPAAVAEPIAGFASHNPGRPHLVFDRAGAEEFIAERFGERELAAFRACAVPAMQADYFRYCAVLELGGVYADVDFRCLRPLDGLLEGLDGGLLFRREPRGELLDGFFAFGAPGHPLPRLALAVATANVERRVSERAAVATGQWLLDGLAALARLGSFDAFRLNVADFGHGPVVESMIAAVGDCERAAEAFADVRVERFDRALEWVAAPTVAAGRRRPAPAAGAGRGAERRVGIATPAAERSTAARTVAVAELPIVQYWHGLEPPAAVAELIAGFAARNPGRPHLVFDRAGAEEFIAKRFGERELAAFRACAVPAMQADYFRYCAVFELGGVYADVDFRCLRPLDGLLEGLDGGLLFRREPPRSLLNGLFAFRAPGHPLLRLALAVATANVERRVSERVDVTTGQWVFNGLAALARLGSFDALRVNFAQLGEEPAAESFVDAVGDCERAAEAFAGVRIESFDRAFEWVAMPEAVLDYKQSDAHWIRWQRSEQGIFRPG